ncbi:MAG: hypothetical protein Q8S20_08520 [Sulfuritalea sp.]|nr:hypothetical protein [Sulfuritalea sp.]
MNAPKSPNSTIVIEVDFHGEPIPCFLAEEDSRTHHCAGTLPPTPVADSVAKPLLFIAREKDSLDPVVGPLPGDVGGERFAITLRPTSSHYVLCFGRAYDERLVEFIENVVLPAKPVWQSSLRLS